MSETSTPSVIDFNPHLVPYQYEVIETIRNYDYQERGVLEILLSGSVGSAKSILMAHIGVTHVMIFSRARVMLGRKSLPDLRDTLITKIMEHIEGVLIDGTDYEYNKTRCSFQFKNGSEMISRTWHDKNFKRFRSLELSAALIEELTENDKNYWPFYAELRARLGRLPHVPEKFIICATNPDSPSHPAYKYFIAAKNPNRKVFYSKTSDNPFLPDNYIDDLKQVYDEKESRRMLFGEWIEIKSETIYYSFSDEVNVIDKYEVKKDLPIIITCDFNIGIGKPMSFALMQYQEWNDTFIVFNEFTIESANTLEILEDMYEKGVFHIDYSYIIHGDANGRARSTKSNRTDYELIKEFFERLRLKFVIDVPTVNPSVRHRHVLINGYLCNAKRINRLFITRNCKTVIEGFRLSKLKKGAGYIEDDSDYFQHITTAIGYGILSQIEYTKRGFNFKQFKF